MAIDRKNLSLRQSILLVAPILSVFVPVVLLYFLKGIPVARVILGGWNLPLIMAAFYLITAHVCKTALEKE